MPKSREYDDRANDVDPVLREFRKDRPLPLEVGRAFGDLKSYWMSLQRAYDHGWADAMSEDRPPGMFNK